MTILRYSVARVGLGVSLILLIPFLFMQLGIGLYDPGSGFETLNWSGFDFIAMGALLFAAGLLLDFIIRKAGKYRVLGIIIVVLLFLWLWAELAVGVFTNWGS